MRRRLAATAVLVLLTGCQSHAKAHSAFDAVATADLAAIASGRCTAVVQHFDALMASELRAPALCRGYRTYLEEYGQLRGQDAANSTRRGALTVVRIPLHLEHSGGEFRETFHADGTVAGVHLLRPGVPL